MNNQLFKQRLLSLSIAAACGVTAPLVMAEEERVAIEEVVVTARHRAENLQEVPTSISAINAENIKQYGARTLEDLQDFVPNFTMGDGANPEITIRGRKNNTRTIGVEAGVGVYVNGVYRSRGGSNVDLFDVERVEVLRGPQGTLYGKNTVSGAINIVIKKPGDEFKTGFLTSIGSQGRKDLQAYVEGGITDTLTARLAVSSIKSDGWMENVVTGRDINGDDTITSQLQLVWMPSDNLTIDLNFDQKKENRIDTKEDAYAIQSPAQAANFAIIGQIAEVDVSTLPYGSIDKVAVITDTTLKVQSEGFSSHIDYEFNNGLMLTSITSARSTDGERLDNDEDNFIAQLLRVDVIEYTDGFTQELRLTSPGGETIDWLVGAYYDSQELESAFIGYASDSYLAHGLGSPAVNGIQLAEGSNPAEVETKSIAIYGSMDWHLNDALTLTVGGRYTKENKDADYTQTADGLCIIGLTAGAPGQDPGIAGAIGALLGGAFDGLVPGRTACGFPQYDLQGLKFDTSNFDPSIALSWNINEDMTAYARASTGYKSGGFNVDILSPDGANLNAFLGLDPATSPLGPLGAFYPKFQYTTPPVSMTFKDETVTSYEVGLKTLFLGNSILANFSVFHDKYENLQVKVKQDETRIVANVTKAQITGAEFDSTWQIDNNWRVIGSYGYVDAQYEGVPKDDTVRFSGEKGEKFGPARWTSSLALDYEKDFFDYGNIAVRVFYNKTYAQIGFYNMRATWYSPDGNITVSAWADKIRDERDTRVGIDKLFGLEYAETKSREPRSYGIDFKYIL